MKTNNKQNSTHLSNNQAALLRHFGTLLCGFVFSLAPVLGQFFPFGIAFTCGVKRKYAIPAAFGAAVGYLINLSAGFSYLAALVAVVAVRMILFDVGGFAASTGFAAILSFLSVFITGISVLLNYTFKNVVLMICQALITGAAAYFFRITANIAPEETCGLNIKQLTALLITLSVALTALCRFTVYSVAPAKIIGVLIVLIAAQYGQAAHGVVAGTAISFTLLLSGASALPDLTFFAFGGLIAGLFSALGPAATALAYLTTTLVAAATLGEAALLGTTALIGLIGGGIFLCIPAKWGNYLGGLFAVRADITPPDTVKGELIMRLQFASGALKDIFNTVEEVAEKLKEVTGPNYETTLAKIEQDACNGCSLRSHCWETEKERTANGTNRIWAEIRAGRHSTEAAEEICDNCLRPKELGRSVFTYLSDLENRQMAQRRLGEIRGVINDQFSGISQMLYDMSEEFQYAVRHDSQTAQTITLALKDLGYQAIRCITTKSKFGRLSADITLRTPKGTQPNKMKIMQHLSSALNLELDSPAISRTDNECFISITEKPRYRLEIGVSQFAQTEGKLCGDRCIYFSDGHGRMNLLLSDGMGTGGRAAVDSAMVAGLMQRLISAGFGYDCALKIINSSMIFKSTDESLATIDLAAIDLFNGECEILKAGAAPTVIRKNGKIGLAESASFPPGILRDIAFDKAVVKCRPDDIIVMMSDGVSAVGTDWICETVKHWEVGSAQQLADNIAAAARRKRNDGHSDDVSVMAAIITKK